MKDFGYVIKNDKGEYWLEEFEAWSLILCYATGYYVKECAMEKIHDYKLKNCRPVKILIEEVEE